LIATFLCLSTWIGDNLVAVPVTYVTVYLGLLDPARIGPLRKGDYSYALFLYGYPIQQAVVATLGEAGLHWGINLAVAYPITFAVAVFSWWCVERPFLKLKPLVHRLRPWSGVQPARAADASRPAKSAAGSSSPGLL
jgi:peptidoglycan/LPS O-acetylase OafA/YrhL